MSRTRVSCALTALVLLAAACGDQPTHPAPWSGPGPRSTISDAATNGANPNVFFLPPLVPNPSGHANFDAGEFNPNLHSAVIRVCRVDGAGACQTQVASFGAGQANGPITISVTDEHYQALWHTDESSPALVPGEPYRIQVFPDADLTRPPVAWADVAVLSSGKELRNLNTSETVGLVNGRTLPIKVRFENGVRCTSDNCLSTRVDDSGATLVLESGDGALVLTEGWLPAGVSEVTVTLERLQPAPGNDCVGFAAYTGLGLIAQNEACLHVTTDPRLAPGEETGTQAPVYIFLCKVSGQVPAALEPFLQIFKADDGRDLQALHDVSHGGIEGFNESCSGGGPSIGLSSNPLMRFASTGWRTITRPLSSVFGVRTLHAVDLGQGGEILLGDAFSYFTFGAQAEAVAYGTVPSTALVGESVPLSVRVLGHKHHGAEEPDIAGIPNITVIFTITDGTGGLSSTMETTNADGVATVTLLPASGPNTVVATSPASGVSGTVQFTTTGMSLVLVRPSSEGVATLPGFTLPITEPSGLSMQASTGIQLEVVPTSQVTWTSSNSNLASVNTSGLLAVVQSSTDPATANAATITATGQNISGSIPVNSFAFNHFPRYTTLVWRPVTGAATYDVITEYGNGCTTGTAQCSQWTAWVSTTTSELRFSFGFVGAQPGRWHVIARDQSGAVISTSEYVYFRYLI